MFLIALDYIPLKRRLPTGYGWPWLSPQTNEIEEADYATADAVRIVRPSIAS
jgi:hypothetical protein